MTNDTHYGEAVRHALSIAMLVSPTGVEQEAFARMHNAAYGERRNHKDVLLDMLGAIQDGVRHGNWPAPGPEAHPMRDKATGPRR
jgi:hypothetical protein